ncbi:MAG: small multi-drug export protein [Candidatus Diapherotrites archaeon]|nr:small multi-drug export protein [Candidatus Diapherotrites archaeon]
MIQELAYLVLITLVPWVELRGSIPYGISTGLNPFVVLIICVAANILLLFPTFLFLDHFFRFVRHWKIVGRVVNRVQKKAVRYVDRWGFLGLMVFVMIPWPGTGAYSGALAAYLLGVPRDKALKAISLGVVIAGVIVTFASIGFKALLL